MLFTPKNAGESEYKHLNQDISWDFYCVGAIRHVYGVALVRPP